MTVGLAGCVSCSQGHDTGGGPVLTPGCVCFRRREREMQRKEAEEARARKKQAFLRCVDFLALCRQACCQPHGYAEAKSMLHALALKMRKS